MEYFLKFHILFKAFTNQSTTKMRNSNNFYLFLSIIFLSFFVSTDTARCNNVDFQKDSTQIIALIHSAQDNSFKNFPKAAHELSQAILITQKLGSTTLLFKMYRSAGGIYEENSRLEEAEAFYKKSLDLIDHVSDANKLDIYIDWAIINKKTGKYKTSKDYYDRTLELAQQIGDIEMVEFAYNGLGTLHSALSEFDKAIDAYLHSIDIAKKRKNIREELVTLTNIAKVYTKSNNFELAFDNIKNAYRLALEINDSTELGGVLNAYGNILNVQKDYPAALIRHQEALAVYEKSNDQSHILETLIYVADVYAQSGQYKLAEQYFKRCFDYKEHLVYYEHPNLYLKLGNLYKKTSNDAKAIESYKKSLELASLRSFKDIIQKSNLGLSQVYQQSGDYKNAYTYLQIANSYGDSLFNEEKSKRLAEAQYKFDVEKSEKEIQSLRLEQNRYWLGTILVFFSVIIISLVYYLRLKGRNNRVLLQKNSEIKFQNERLEKSNEILHQFAYASAHDLKEPLRSISSFVHIIQRRYSKLLPPEAGEYMDFVVGGVKRMESLLSALLEYSTVASDEQEVKHTTSLKLALSDVKHNLHSTIIEKNANVDCEGFLPMLWISRLHLTQLFQNLISNSLKFSNKQPHIKVFGQVQGANLLITVKDNGIGMKLEYSDKIFRLFQRLSRSPQYEGTGIGLAICKHIVDKYNGKIWFESVEGEGTTFYLSFPMKIVQNELKTEGVDINPNFQVQSH